MAIQYNGPDPNALAQQYAYAPGAPDLSATMMPYTDALNKLAVKQKSRAKDEMGLLGMGDSSNMQARLAGIDQDISQQESDMFYQAAAARTQRQYEERKLAEERARQQQALDQQRQQGMITGLAGLFGGGLGAGIGGLGLLGGGGPMSALFGSQIGADLGKGIAGLPCGAQPEMGGLGALMGNMAQQDLQKKQFTNQNDLLSKLAQMIQGNGGQTPQYPQTPGYGTNTTGNYASLPMPNNPGYQISNPSTGGGF